MLKLIFKDTCVYALGTFITSFINLLFLPVLARLLTVSEFGVVSLVSSLTTISAYVVTLNITQATSRYVAQAKDLSEKQIYASSGLWFVLCAYFFVAIVAMLGFKWVAPLLLGVDNFSLYLSAILSIVLSGIFFYFNSQLRWILKPKAFVTSSVLMVFVFVCVAYYAIAYLHLGAQGYFWGLSLGYLSGALVAYGYCRSLFKWIFSRSKLRLMLAFSAPLAVASVVGYLYLTSDKWAIRLLLNFNDLGIYGVASRLVSIGPAVMGVISLGLLPYIYSSYQQPQFAKSIALLFRLVLFFAFSGALLFLILEKPLMLLLVGPNFSAAGEYIPLLFIGVLFTSLYDFTPGMWIYGKTYRIAVVNVLTGIVNTGLNFLLIPCLGLWGAVIAMLISGGVVFMGSVLLSQKLYAIPYNWVRVAGAMMVFIGAYYCLAVASLGLWGRLLLLFLVIVFMGLILLASKDTFKVLVNYFQRIRQRVIEKVSLAPWERFFFFCVQMILDLKERLLSQRGVSPLIAYCLSGCVIKDLPVLIAQNDGKPLPNDLIIKPDYYQIEAKVYDLNTPGIYRFMFLGQKNIQRIVYLPEEDVISLLSAITWLSSHGSEDDGKSNDECYELAKSRKLLMTCQDMAVFSRYVLEKLGLSARLVFTVTLADWNGVDDGHVMLEVYCPRRKKWLLYDPDFGVCFQAQNEFLSLVDFSNDHFEQGFYEVYPLARPILGDVHSFRAKNGYRYDFLLEATTADLKMWYRKIMQVRAISVEGKVYYTSHAEQVVERVSALCPHYYYLSPQAFSEKFYSGIDFK